MRRHSRHRWLATRRVERAHHQAARRFPVPGWSVAGGDCCAGFNRRIQQLFDSARDLLWPWWRAPPARPEVKPDRRLSCCRFASMWYDWQGHDASRDPVCLAIRHAGCDQQIFFARADSGVPLPPRSDTFILCSSFGTACCSERSESSVVGSPILSGGRIFTVFRSLKLT